MRNFTLCIPTKIIFGAGESKDISAHIQGLGKRALLLSYGERPYLKDLFADVKAALDKVGISYVQYLHISANPRLSQVREAAEFCKQEHVDFIIGIGGGSVMDAAKAIAGAVRYSGDIWNMFTSRNDRPVAVPPSEALPTVMIPTVAATSSEMNCVGVVTNDETAEKVHVSAPCLYPAVSVIDPALTLTLPPAQTAAGAVDAMSHILEAYVGGDQSSPLQDGLNESLLRTIMTELTALLQDPRNLEHRTNLQWATTIAWNGWIQAGTYPRTTMHKMGHAVSALYHVTHGVTLAIFMNGYLHDICCKNEEIAQRFAVLGHRLFGQDLPTKETCMSLSAECIDRMISFFEASGVPTTLSGAGVNAPDLDGLCELILRVGAGADGCIPGLVPVNRTDMMRILRSVL